MRTQSGFSLIEVLISISILSITLLCATIGCLHSLRITQEAMYQSYAWIHAQTLAQYLQGCIQTEFSNPECGLQGLSHYKSLIQRGLPNAQVRIAIDNKSANVNIHWTPKVIFDQQGERSIQIRIDDKGWQLQ